MVVNASAVASDVGGCGPATTSSDAGNLAVSTFALLQLWAYFASAAFLGWALFWLMSLIWVGRVSRLNVMPLVTGPLKVVALVGIPCGASALAATLIPLPPLLQVIVGTCFAIAWFGFALLISRKVRGDARSLVRFGRLALGR